MLWSEKSLAELACGSFHLALVPCIDMDCPSELLQGMDTESQEVQSEIKISALPGRTAVLDASGRHARGIQKALMT